MQNRWSRLSRRAHSHTVCVHFSPPAPRRLPPKLKSVGSPSHSLPRTEPTSNKRRRTKTEAIAELNGVQSQHQHGHGGEPTKAVATVASNASHPVISQS
eukprot:5325843-Amphidinium_carterae.1